MTAAPAAARHGRVLVARLDSLGDVLLAGPAVRAVAREAAEVTLLVGDGRRTVAELLPGVDRVLEYTAPWVVLEPEPLRPAAVLELVDTLRARRFDAALILTSFHQSPLPLALLLRMAGVGWIGAISEDYPGALLDLRHHVPAVLPEAGRNLSLAEAGGWAADEQGARLAVRRPWATARPDQPFSHRDRQEPGEPYVVFHPGAATPARRPTTETSRALVAGLVGAGHRVLVTGSASETGLTAYVAGDRAVDLGGRLDLSGLAELLEGAQVVVAPNTGPGHLAAAVGTPVVSLFAPVVNPANWAPYGVPTVVLGDQHAPCRDTRARTCPVPGHPCLSSITPDQVVAAVASLGGTPATLAPLAPGGLTASHGTRSAAPGRETATGTATHVTAGTLIAPAPRTPAGSRPAARTNPSPRKKVSHGPD